MQRAQERGISPLLLNSFVQKYTIVHNFSYQRTLRNIASNYKVPDVYATPC